MPQLTSAGGSQSAKNLRPFRYSTRQRMQQFATVPIVIGSQVTTDLPRTGLVSGIILNFAAVMTLSGAGVFTYLGPWGFLQRIVVNLNTGASQIFNCSGLGTRYVNARMIRSGIFPDNNQLAGATSNIGANTVYFSFYIPIAMNDELQFENGLINLQAPEVRMSLDLTFANAGSNVVTNFTSITGSVNLSYVYYELPNPHTTLYPPLALHRILEDQQAITQTGDQVYFFPLGGSLMQLTQFVVLNGAIASLQQGVATNLNMIDSIRMVLNNTDTVIQLPGRAQAMWQALNQAGPNPVGDTIDWNLFDAGVTRTGEGDSRDWINSEMLSVLQFIPTINPGAVVGTVASLNTIRRIFQPLQA